MRRRRKMSAGCRCGEADISISQRRHTHNGAMLDMTRREFLHTKKGYPFRITPFIFGGQYRT